LIALSSRRSMTNAITDMPAPRIARSNHRYSRLPLTTAEA